MANFTSIVALLFLLFNFFQVVLFEKEEKVRKLLFGLTPALIPLTEILVNLVFLHRDSRDLGKELKRMFFSYIFFDYFGIYEEYSIINESQTYCNQAYNRSCRTVKNIFPAYSLRNSNSLNPLVSSDGVIKENSIKPVCNFIPKASFCFTMEVKRANNPRLFTNFPKRIEVEDFMNKNYYYNYNTVKLPGVLKMGNDPGGVKLSDIKKAGVYKIFSKEGKLKLYERGEKVKKLNYSNFLNWLEIIKDGSVVIENFEYEFKFKKEDEMPMDFKVGRLSFTYDFRNVMVGLENGSGVYNYPIEKKFIKQFQIIHDLSCWVEYPEVGITKSIKFCQRRERNINHCHTFQELIRLCNHPESGGYLRRLTLYRYRTKCIYNVKKDNGFIIVEGDKSEEVSMCKLGTMSEGLGQDSKEKEDLFGCENGAYVTLLYSIMHSIFEESGKYFQVYIDKKCSQLNLDDSEKEKIIYSLITNYFEERCMLTNNWQKKRIKADLSYIKLSLGLDYFKRTDTKIVPSRNVLGILKSIQIDLERGEIKKMSEETLIKNMAKSELPNKLVERLGKKFSCDHLINRSLGHIKKLTKYSNVVPKSLKGELRLENKKKIEVKTSLRSLRNKGNELKKVDYNNLKVRWLNEHNECKDEMFKRGVETVKRTKPLPENVDKSNEGMKYNVNVFKKSYKQALIDRMKVKGKEAFYQTVKRIIVRRKDALGEEISRVARENVPVDFKSHYSELKASDFRKKGKVEVVRERIKEKSKEFFFTKNTLESYKNRYSVLEMGEKEVEKRIHDLQNSKESKEAIGKSLICFAAFNLEKMGLNSLMSKRQRRQAIEVMSVKKNRVCKEKLIDFNDFSGCKGITIKESVDYSKFELEIEKYVKKASLSEIRTYKRIENPSLNHWAFSEAVDKDLNMDQGKEKKKKKKKENNNREGFHFEETQAYIIKPLDKTRKGDYGGKRKVVSETQMLCLERKTKKLKLYHFSLNKFAEFKLKENPKPICKNNNSGSSSERVEKGKSKLKPKRIDTAKIESLNTRIKDIKAEEELLRLYAERLKSASNEEEKELKALLRGKTITSRIKKKAFLIEVKKWENEGFEVNDEYYNSVGLDRTMKPEDLRRESSKSSIK